MKVDFITLHIIKNYGSALQTYATQKIFEKLGVEVETINYVRNDVSNKNIINTRISTSNVFSKNIITRMIGKIIIGLSVKKQIKVFDSFLSRRINLSPIYNDINELKENPPLADVYCTGSDQVWNSTWNKGIDKAYFLEFVKNKKKISYASSIGKTEIDKSESDVIIPMLKEYSNISVREKSAVDLLKKFGIESTLVLDPTLLLTVNDWKQIAEKRLIKEKYILVYQLDSKNKDMDKYVKKLAKKKKMKIVRASNMFYQVFKYGKFLNCPTVEEFLSLFLYADYIVADSFHATAFSINFNKKFLSVFPKKFGTRLQNILELTGLQDRKLLDYDDLSLVDSNIDWNSVNKIINSEREKSIKWLKQAIEI